MSLPCSGSYAEAAAKPGAGPPHALRIVNDGAIGSCAGNGGEAQVHEVSLLPATDAQ